MPPPARSTPTPWIALAPAPAVALATVVAHLHGVAVSAFLPNIVAVALGVLAIAWLGAASRRPARRAKPTWIGVAALAALLGALAATLLAPGVDGVHRWVPLGPLELHPSALLSPWLLVTLASACGTAVKPLLLVLCGVEALHLAQPDAAQATALALGALPILAKTPTPSKRFRIMTAVILMTLAGATWLRPDPLAPVAHVERILDLARASGLGWFLACLAGAVLLLAPAVPTRAGAPRAAATRLRAQVAFGVYFMTTLIITSFGNFPVPVLGAGAAPVLGWYATLGAMSVAGRRAGSAGA